MSEKDKEQDLQDVIREEGRRGRRPVDLATQRERNKALTAFRDLLKLGTEEEFIEAMRAFGIRENSPQFVECLRIWREREP